jgi:hypothetical protein
MPWRLHYQVPGTSKLPGGFSVACAKGAKPRKSSIFRILACIYLSEFYAKLLYNLLGISDLGQDTGVPVTLPWRKDEGGRPQFITKGEIKHMRSDRVFDALQTLRNRYMLCQLASKATRKFHRPSTRIQETMNGVLDRIAGAERQAVLSEPENFAEAQRRAA